MAKILFCQVSALGTRLVCYSCAWYGVRVCWGRIKWFLNTPPIITRAIFEVKWLDTFFRKCIPQTYLARQRSQEWQGVENQFICRYLSVEAHTRFAINLTKTFVDNAWTPYNGLTDMCTHEQKGWRWLVLCPFSTPLIGTIIRKFLF